MCGCSGEVPWLITTGVRPDDLLVTSETLYYKSMEELKL